MLTLFKQFAQVNSLKTELSNLKLCYVLTYGNGFSC
jgi:hypothetical protein